MLIIVHCWLYKEVHCVQCNTTQALCLNLNVTPKDISTDNLRTVKVLGQIPSLVYWPADLTANSSSNTRDDQKYHSFTGVFIKVSEIREPVNVTHWSQIGNCDGQCKINR